MLSHTVHCFIEIRGDPSPQETPQCERDAASRPVSPSVRAFIWSGRAPTIPLETASNLSPFLFPLVLKNNDDDNEGTETTTQQF